MGVSREEPRGIRAEGLLKRGWGRGWRGPRFGCFEALPGRRPPGAAAEVRERARRQAPCRGTVTRWRDSCGLCHLCSSRVSGSQAGGDAQGSEATLLSWGLATESAWRETEARAPRRPELARKRAADLDAALPVWARQVRSRWQGGGRDEGRRWAGQGGRALVGGWRPVFVARGRDTVTAGGGGIEGSSRTNC